MAQAPTASDPLDVLFADRKIGAASKLAFYQLWRFAGCRAGRVVITADWLAGLCGRSPKAAWLWLDELEHHDLVKLGERNERRGSIEVDVYNPCPGDRAATTDPQMHLGLALAEVSAPKPPSPLVPKKQEDLSCHSTIQSAKDTKAPRSMEGAFAATTSAAIAASDPAAQKERLKVQICAACRRGGPITDWVAGSAANLVVYHGVPIEELMRVLCDVQAMGEVGSLRNPAAFFHAKARELAERYGAPWPRPR